MTDGRYEVSNSIGQTFPTRTMAWAYELARQQRERGFGYQIIEVDSTGRRRILETGRGFF